jgi:hypothetical protein
MQQARVPLGITAPESLTINLTPAGFRPPPPGPLAVGCEVIDGTDLTTVTGASILVTKPDGTVVTWAASYASTGGSASTVVHAFAALAPATPLGDCDQVGNYALAPTLVTPSGSVPCQAAVLTVMSQGSFSTP